MSMIKRLIAPFYSAAMMVYYKYLGKTNPQKLASIRYAKTMGKQLNWENPKDLNEIINWLKFNSDTTQWPMLADKYRVREYVKDKGLEYTLNTLYGVWENPDDIDFDALPASFVLKSNNGYASVLIVKDKNQLDIKETRKLLRSWLRNKYGYSTAEPHYIKIKPLIIAEQLLEENDSQSFSLIDYKVHCFNGTPDCIKLCYDRKIHHDPKFEIYTLDWTLQPQNIVPAYRGTKLFPKPELLEEMLNCSKILSEGHPCMRVDWYIVNNKLYFGEITMTPAAGYISFYPYSFLLELGSKIKL